ncbi:MAG: hypothetical protein ACREJC_07965, partial [Tepidisphaeraceae bacterium]
VISYYDKSKGDLRMASSASEGGFTLTTLDTGTTGTKDVGRFSSLVLDPSRPTASKWGIAYEDTGGQRYRYAIQGTIRGGEQKNGYTFYDIDTTVTKLGGFTSLAFDGSNRPCVAFYDSLNSALKYATGNNDTLNGNIAGGIGFTSKFVASKDLVGYYSNLFFDTTGKATIFYWDRTHNKAMRARLVSGAWSFTTLADGGRQIHVARFDTLVAYTNLNESIPELAVLFA